MQWMHLRTLAKWVAVGLTVVSLNLVLALSGLGGFLQCLAVLLLGAIGLGNLLAASCTRDPGRARVHMTTGVITVSSLLSIPLGWQVLRYEVDRAQRFCEALRPSLEQYRASTGVYPSRLTDVSNERSLPRLLREAHGFYEPVKGGYRFSFPDPSRIFADYEFRSSDSTWSYWD